MTQESEGPNIDADSQGLGYGVILKRMVSHLPLLVIHLKVLVILLA